MENLKKFLPKTFSGWLKLGLLAFAMIMFAKGHPEGVIPAMAFLDQENMFSGINTGGVLSGQVVAGPGTVISTNIIDQVAARVLGAGRVPDLLVEYNTVIGAATTLQAILYGADDAAFAVNKTVLADTGTTAVIAAGSSGFLRAAIKVAKAKRYLRVEYVLVGAGSGANFISGFVDQEQTTPETIS